MSETTKGRLRHPLVVAIVVVAIIALALILLSRRGPAEIQMTVVSWGGTTQDALREAVFKPFAEETGISVVEDSYNGELEILRDMVVQRAVRWDVVHVEDDMMFKAADEGWLETVPQDAVSDPGLREFSEGYGVPIFAWGTVLAWNEDRLEKAGVSAPSDWSAIWDSAYEGPIGLRKSPISTVEIALLGNGYDKSSLYPLTPAKIKEALGYLETIRAKISWWSGGAEHQQKLLTEYSLAAAWSGRVWVMIDQGERVDMTYNQGLTRYDWWVIPKGTPRMAEANRFLRFAAMPKVQARFCELTGYGPGTSEARTLLSDRIKQYAPVVGDSGTAIVLDGRWWAENIGWVQDLWIQWLGE